MKMKAFADKGSVVTVCGTEGVRRVYEKGVPVKYSSFGGEGKNNWEAEYVLVFGGKHDHIKLTVQSPHLTNKYIVDVFNNFGAVSLIYAWKQPEVDNQGYVFSIKGDSSITKRDIVRQIHADWCWSSFSPIEFVDTAEGVLLHDKHIKLINNALFDSVIKFDFLFDMTFWVAQKGDFFFVCDKESYLYEAQILLTGKE